MTLTICVNCQNDPEGLKYTLEGLVEQTTEEFDVLLADNGADEATKKIIDEYAGEYVGFSVIRIDACTPFAARNAAVKQAKGELVLFMDEGDYISPETVESIYAAAEKTKADIVCLRCYISGEHEPYYNEWADMLATVPEIDRFDRALLNSLDLEGRVYKKKFFDLYSVRFPEKPVLSNAKVLTDCVFGCGAKITGIAGGIYDRRRGVFSHGFPEGGEPGKESFDIAVGLFDNLLGAVKSMIEEATGKFDGDEYTFQEMLTVYFDTLTDRFYRLFWFLDDETIDALRMKYEQITALMTKERRETINKRYADLRFPGMYMKRSDAAMKPLFTLLCEFGDPEGVAEFIESLYTQRFPFFEVYLKESVAGAIPERYKNNENLYILPDKGFFEKARNEASGVSINVKTKAPFDPKLLSELSVSKAPRGMIPYLFATKRKSYATKTYLKKRGLAMK